MTPEAEKALETLRKLAVAHVYDGGETGDYQIGVEALATLRRELEAAQAPDPDAEVEQAIRNIQQLIREYGGSDIPTLDSATDRLAALARPRVATAPELDKTQPGGSTIVKHPNPTPTG